MPKPTLDMAIARRVIETALAEDLGDDGDTTTAAVISEDARARGRLIAREAGVICGLDVAAMVFAVVDDSVVFKSEFVDGAGVKDGAELATVAGRAQPIFAAERTALNLLQHLSGVATVTARAVQSTAGTKARIFDTRKTLPGLRELEKYAVAVGGGINHRMGLFDGLLVKDNHLKLVGGVADAVACCRRQYGRAASIEVEAETLGQVEEALAAGVDVIMLDNMTIAQVKEAVRLVATRAVLEVSGGITPEDVEEMAWTGVDRISMGVLTDAARMDISLEIDT